MKILLALIPILAILAGAVVYKQHGKREILRFDSVQFFYAFILMPVAYVWFKGFLFFLLQSQLQTFISQADILFWDTVYSVLFLFLYAFTVIHSLTKSFQLKRKKDPLYDLFEHSEYYHMWMTHSVILVGGMILFLLLAALNAWIDLPLAISRQQFYSLLLLALGMSWLIFQMFLLLKYSDFWNVKLIKLLVGIFFVLHIIVYAVFEPSFAGEKVMYWYQLTFFFGLSVIGIIYPSEQADKGLHKRIKHKVSLFWQRLFPKR